MYCGSDNIEVLDVELENTSIYDFEKIVAKCKYDAEFMFIVNIDKRNHITELTPGGNREIESNFLINAIKYIYNFIENKPDSFYIPKPIGNLNICLTGSHDIFERQSNIRLERFRSAGLSKDEILSEIVSFSEGMGLDLF